MSAEVKTEVKRCETCGKEMPGEQCREEMFPLPTGHGYWDVPHALVAKVKAALVQWDKGVAECNEANKKLRQERGQAEPTEEELARDADANYSYEAADILTELGYGQEYVCDGCIGKTWKVEDYGKMCEATPETVDQVAQELGIPREDVAWVVGLKNIPKENVEEIGGGYALARVPREMMQNVPKSVLKMLEEEATPRTVSEVIA